MLCYATYFDYKLCFNFQVFTLTMVAIDPFMQVSEPVTLRLMSRLLPVFTNPLLPTNIGMKPFVFQVFSIPLFSYTGALSIVQKHNIQVGKMAAYFSIFVPLLGTLYPSPSCGGISQ